MTEGPFTVSAFKSGIDSFVGAAGTITNGYTPSDEIVFAAYNEVNAEGLANNAPISTVSDQSGNGLQYAQFENSQRPLNKTNVLNGYAVAETDGLTQYMKQRPIPYGVRTYFVVIRALPGQATDPICGFDVASGYGRLTSYAAGGSTRWKWEQYGIEDSYVDLGVEREAWGIFQLRIVSASSAQVRFNDRPWIQINPYDLIWSDPALPSQYSNIGTHDTGDQAKVQWAFSGITLSAPSDAKCTEFCRYLNTRYEMY